MIKLRVVRIAFAVSMAVAAALMWVGTLVVWTDSGPVAATPLCGTCPNFRVPGSVLTIEGAALLLIFASLPIVAIVRFRWPHFGIAGGVGAFLVSWLSIYAFPADNGGGMTLFLEAMLALWLGAALAFSAGIAQLLRVREINAIPHPSQTLGIA